MHTSQFWRRARDGQEDTSDGVETGAECAGFPTRILSMGTDPAGLSMLSRLEPQPKSEGLLALVHRKRSRREEATSSENVCIDHQSDVPVALESSLLPDQLKDLWPSDKGTRLELTA